MGLWSSLFGGVGSADSGPIVPKNESEQEVLACVLQYVMLAELGGRLKGVEPRRKSAVGPRVKEEYALLREVRAKHGLSYRDLENAFWDTDLVQTLTPLGLHEKRAQLGALNKQDWRTHSRAGKAVRSSTKSDGVVFYLLAIAYEVMGVDPSAR